jgi:hypothetical protein
VTTINTKADTGNMEKAEQGSQQGLIDKQEREERHTTDSDSDTQHTSSKSGTGNTDKPLAPVGANSMEGQPTIEAEFITAPSDKERDDTAITIIQEGQKEDTTEGKDDSTEATMTGSVESEQPSSGDRGSTTSDSTKGEDTVTETEEQRKQSDPGREQGQIYRVVYEAAYMVATTFGRREVHVRGHFLHGHGQ